MSIILVWVLGTVVCALLTVVLAVVAISKRSMRSFWFALALLVVTVLCGAMVLYHITTRTYAHVKDMVEPRSGTEIYAALFAGSPSTCVRILAHRDQLIPKLDTGIQLSMSTCPEELDRILAMGNYTADQGPVGSLDLAVTERSTVFDPARLGDTVRVFTWEVVPGRNWRWIYTSLDSTQAICVDMLD